MWSPHTATNIHKLESVLRQAAKWATRYYRYTSSVTSMLQDLNWRTLDQRRIDSRLNMMYKVTHDLVAIPASDYLTPYLRQSRHIHPLAFVQIPTLKDYYKYTFFSGKLCQPTSSYFLPWCNSAMLCASCSIFHLKFQYLFSCFNYINPFNFSPYKLISPTFLNFCSTNPTSALGLLETHLKSSYEVKIDR